MNNEWLNVVLDVTGADSARCNEVIQTLWSGYGEILRIDLQGAEMASVILKYVQPPADADHPRGWNTDRSHQRKLKSYQIEMHWYQQWASQCDDQCRVPHCYGVVERDQQLIIVLEDLDGAGFALRKQSVTQAELMLCLKWLAHFHAQFMSQQPDGLWPVGTYWHLATRPDELQAMTDKTLQAAASTLDQQLSACRYQTLVHGDAKLANFCFSETAAAVAAVDFQYVGGGCGMKDVAYLLGSALSESDCERYESRLLDCYFETLCSSLSARKKIVDCVALEAEWRSLYPVAWTDFYRFLQGWMPGHQKINSYTRKLAQSVLSSVNS